MHLEEPAHDFALSSAGHLPVTAGRLSQKVLLVLLRGDMWVQDTDGRRREISGPTWVVWYPGEAIEYGALGETVHWLIAAPTGPVPPGMPRPGSLVRLDVGDDRGTTDDEALLVHYLDDSAEQSGITSLVARAADGIGIHPLGALTEVLEEADEDRREFVYGPGLDEPLRLTRR